MKSSFSKGTVASSIVVRMPGLVAADRARGFA
jgi:hypothetical protein